ncbi:MAG: hypothetical protein AABX10_03925 [Nanoarchaeota archaeon]
MNIKYYIDEKGNKVYTLKESNETKDAHYKFIKFKDAGDTHHSNH